MATVFNPSIRCYGDYGRPTIDGTWKNFVSDFGAVADGVLVPQMLDRNDGLGTRIAGYSITGTNNTTALNAWRDYGISLGTAAAKLYIPPGNYHFPGGGTLTGYDPSGDPADSASQTILNAYISGYGAVFDLASLGPSATIRQDQIHSARFATSSVGATSITLIDAGAHLATDISRFSVGQWILIKGVSLQNYGYPPSPQFFEYRQISGIVGNVISFTTPLTYAYKSTWPEIDLKTVSVSSGANATVTLNNHGLSANQTIFFDIFSGGTIPTGITHRQTYFVISTGITTNTFRFSTTMGGVAVTTSSTGSSVCLHTNNTDLGGPATIYALRENFKSSYEVYGLRITDFAQVNVVGAQNAFLCGMYFDGDGPAPTVGKSILIARTQTGSKTENDKCITSLTYDTCSASVGLRNADFQSAGIENLTIKNCTYNAVSGLGKYNTIDNCHLSLLTPMPTAYGHGSTLSISNTTVTSVNMSNRSVDLSAMSFSAGTFSFPLVVATNNGCATFVPGTKCAFGRYLGGLVINPDSGPQKSFTVTDIRQDATTMFIDTDWAGAVPPAGVNYGGSPAELVANYALDTGGLTTSNYAGPSLAGFVAP